MSFMPFDKPETQMSRKIVNSQEKSGMYCRHFFVAFQSFYDLESPIAKKVVTFLG
jgi:hypothetical protein